MAGVDIKDIMCDNTHALYLYHTTYMLTYSKTMREGAAIIDPEEDYMTIAAAEETMSHTEAARRKDLDQAKSKLKGLSLSTHHVCVSHRASRSTELARVLEAARVSSTRPSTVPSADAHAATLNRLDGTRLSLVKAINEAESALASKEAELARLKDELYELEQEDPAAEHELDATAYASPLASSNLQR